MSEPTIEQTTLPTVKEDIKRRRTSLKKDYNYDSEGRKLTKKGTLDRRAVTSRENLKKSRVTQALEELEIIKKERIKEEAKQIPETIVEESEEEEDEYEIEEYIIKPKGEPQVVTVEVEKPDLKAIAKAQELERKNKELVQKATLMKGIDLQIRNRRDTQIHWRFPKKEM